MCWAPAFRKCRGLANVLFEPGGDTPGKALTRAPQWCATTSVRMGAVVSIHVTTTAGGPMRSVEHARAVVGRGLEGDRYFDRAGTYSSRPGPDREVTLVELESIQALERDYGVRIHPGDARRNLVTQGVSLNHLVGRAFRVGDAILRGIRLCEPCSHLARLTGKDVVPGLVHRGGLRAQVLEGGVIRPGDEIEEIPSEAPSAPAVHGPDATLGPSAESWFVAILRNPYNAVMPRRTSRGFPWRIMRIRRRSSTRAG